MTTGKAAHRVRWQGTAENHAEAVARLRIAGDVVLVHRGHPRWLVLMCPCGCGESFSLSVSASVKPQWRFYLRRGTLTLYPSVWRDSGCRSHFIVWNDRVDWLQDEDGWPEVPSDLEDKVLAVLTPSHL